MNEREIQKYLAPESSFLIAAHELKSPLSIIRQLSLTLADPNLELGLNDTDRLINQISVTSERALRLVQDLTKVSRLESAMFKLEPVNVQKVCEDLIYETTEAFKLNNKKIVHKKRSLNIGNSNLAVANYELLHSVIMNFIDNSLYSSASNSQVELSVKKVKSKIRISVRDYGEPLAANVLNMVSDDKAALNNASSRPQSSGLGIYIAKNFAQVMSSKVGAIRHKDGNTFFIDLNISEQLSLL